MYSRHHGSSLGKVQVIAEQFSLSQVSVISPLGLKLTHRIHAFITMTEDDNAIQMQMMAVRRDVGSEHVSISSSPKSARLTRRMYLLDLAASSTAHEHSLTVWKLYWKYGTYSVNGHGGRCRQSL